MTSTHLKHALIRNDGTTAQRLQINVKIDDLLDEGKCKLMEEDLGDYCDQDGWEVKAATPWLADQLPERCGLYMFVWRPPLVLSIAESKQKQRLMYVLYIGQTGSNGGGGTLRSRYENAYKKYVSADPEHLWATSLNNREARLRCFLNLEDLQYWFLVFDDHTKLKRAEDRLTDLLSPPLNLRGGLLRPGPRRPGFKPHSGG